jgi:hypothetical protein
LQLYIRSAVWFAPNPVFDCPQSLASLPICSALCGRSDWPGHINITSSQPCRPAPLAEGLARHVHRNFTTRQMHLPSSICHKFQREPTQQLHHSSAAATQGLCTVQHQPFISYACPSFTSHPPRPITNVTLLHVFVHSDHPQKSSCWLRQGGTFQLHTQASAGPAGRLVEGREGGGRKQLAVHG